MLDCVLENYPCSFDAVELSVIERSLALSDEVAEQLVDGAEIAQVAAFLESQADIVDVTVDGPVLGFRLAGGRPMIVDVSGDQDMLPSGSEAGVAARGRAAASLVESAAVTRLRSTPGPALNAIVGGGNKPQRHALVLSPYRFEAGFGDAGEWIAGALDGIRGYAGNVTYLATTNEFDPQVTVDVLTQLHDYDVIHIDTHGGTLCKDKADPAGGISASTAEKGKCDDGITDFLVQRFHGTASDLQAIAHPGVVHYRGRLHQSIAITADFFRHYYPDGLADQLFILGSCNTYRADMANAIAGSRGVYLSWDGATERDLVRDSGLALLGYLGQGLTVSEAMDRLPPLTTSNPGAEGSALQQTGRRIGGDLRIRDLITVRDNLTGRLVSDTSGIEVMEIPGDGQNDHLDLEFTIDGITPEELANFYLNLVVNDHVIGHLNYQMSGVPVDEFRYRISTPIPLPFDAQEGQVLNMDFWIPLPDLGEDHFVAAPRVNGREVPDIGTEWVLTSRATRSAIDDDMIISATVTFRIDPENDPDSRFHFFGVQHGSMSYQRQYIDARGCQFNVNRTITIPAGAGNNYLRFDTGSDMIMVNGFGSVPTEPVEATSSCGNATVNAGGTYFIGNETPVSGTTVSGGYNSGSTYPTIIEWTLSRTE